ncbi:P2X purinoceptor 7-like [Saccostrea cucullata]|uniref:P2X purinoceptor 7-like n=1 Tax=Saccostrea cuccullata TaxID=36930 RepID=UPI002ED0AC9C
METTRECKCCFGIPDVARKVHKGNLKCITEHDSFVVNCLNHHVLKLSNYEYMQDNGPIGDDEPVNELYRHLAYRRFARFIWKRLGRYNRRILPSCVVDAIRKQFPSQQYCGFRYPGEEK